MHFFLHQFLVGNSFVVTYQYCPMKVQIPASCSNMSPKVFVQPFYWEEVDICVHIIKSKIEIRFNFEGSSIDETFFSSIKRSMFKTIVGTQRWSNSFFVFSVLFGQIQYVDWYNICPILTNAIHGPASQIFNLCRQFTRNCPLHNFDGQVFSSSPPEEGFLDWIECVQSDLIFAKYEIFWKNTFIRDGFCKEFTIPETDGWEHKIVQKPAMIQQSYTDHYCFQSTPPDLLALFLPSNNA